MSEIEYRFDFTSEDFINSINALESRAEAYEMTAAYYRGEAVDGIIEEVKNEDEALAIAASFRKSLAHVSRQYRAQR